MPFGALRTFACHAPSASPSPVWMFLFIILNANRRVYPAHQMVRARKTAGLAGGTKKYVD